MLISLCEIQSVQKGLGSFNQLVPSSSVGNQPEPYQHESLVLKCSYIYDWYFQKNFILLQCGMISEKLWRCHFKWNFTTRLKSLNFILYLSTSVGVNMSVLEAHWVAEKHSSYCHEITSLNCNATPIIDREPKKQKRLFHA